MRHRLVSWAKRFLITMTFLGVTTANASDPELDLPKVFLSGIAYDLAVIDPDLSATDYRQLTPLLRINDVLYTPSESANGWVFSEVVIDLDQIREPMIADPDVNNNDISKRYTHDTIRPISFYEAKKKVDLGFVGSCMVHKGDMKILAQMLKNMESKDGSVEFKAPLVVAPPTYNIVDELKEEGDWDVLAKYAGFEFNDADPKSNARKKYDNILYLERPGCNLCMGNQEKAEPGDTVMATSTRLFQGRVVKDSDDKKGESLLSSTPVVVLSTILGRTPTFEEYKYAVKGIDLTKFALA